MDFIEEHDPTGVIEIRQQFGSRPSFKKPSSLCLDDEEPVVKKHKNLILKDVLEKEKANQLQAANLASARAEVCSLKEQICSLQKELKENQVVFERNVEQLESKGKLKDSKILGLEHDIESQEAQLKKLKEALSETRLQLESSQQQLQRTKMSAVAERAELLYQADKNLTAERATLLDAQKHAINLESELSAKQAELELVNKQLQMLDSRCSQLVQEMRQMESQCTESLEMKVKCQNLEQKLSAQEAENVVSRSVTAQLKRLQVLEKENKELASDNRILRNERENVLLLREQNTDLSARVEQLTQSAARLPSLQEQCNILKEKLADWKSFTTTKGVDLSPAEAVRQLGAMQTSNALLLEQNGQLNSNVRDARARVSRLQQEVDSVRSQLESCSTERKQLESQLNRVQREKALVCKDRDHLETLLGQDMSLDSSVEKTRRVEMTLNMTQQTRHIAAKSERLLQQKEQELRQMEQMKDQAERRAKLLLQQMEQKQQEQTTAEAEERSSKLLREQLAETEELLHTERERCAQLQATAELRRQQGDYDCSKFKVLHLLENPTTIRIRERKQLVTELQQERRSLRDQLAEAKERIRVLEEGQMQDVTMAVQQRLEEKSEVDPHELRDLQQKLHYSELRLVRYKEVADRQCQQLRKAFTALLGYRLSLSTENGVNMYRLHSVYGDPSELLLFRHTPESGVEMMETDYVLTLSALSEQHLQQRASIPSFLAALTLQLTEQQAQT